MLITTVSAPVPPRQAKGNKHEKTCHEFPLVSEDINGGIFQECVIEQKVEKIPDELLARPSNDETWRRYFVLVHQLEPLLPSFEKILSMHIVGKTSDDKHYDVVICDSCAQYLHHIGCAFELESDDLESDGFELVHAEPAESFNFKSDGFEFVYAEPTESAEPAEPAESFDFESYGFEFVHTEPTEPTESAEPAAEPIEYLDFVSVDVVFVEFAKLKFDDLEFEGSDEPVSDKIESKKLRKSLHYDVSQPKKGEIEVYGIHEATTRARVRFIMNAVGAISSAEHGRGLDQYYLSSPNYTNNCGFSVAMKWAIFFRDVKSSKKDVRRQFFQHCLFITLHTLDDLDTACDLELARWTDIEWLSFIEEISLTRWQLQSAEADMQVLSLLQAVFASACDGMRSHVHAFNGSHSALGNLEILSSVFLEGAELEAVPFGSLERMSLERLLPKFKVFEECDDLDVTKITEKIMSFVLV